MRESGEGAQMTTVAGAKCGNDLPDVVVDAAEGPVVDRQLDLHIEPLRGGAISSGGRASSLRGWLG